MTKTHAAPPARPVRILHLEDNISDQELLTEMLSFAEIDCEIVHADSHDTFETALKNRDVNLIISDFTMPGYSGVRALQLAQETRKTVPFIFFSGTIGEEAAIQSLKNGATDYVLKQHPDRLISAIRRALKESEDKTARARVEEELRQRDLLLRQIMENVEDLIIVSDFQGRRMMSSPSYQKLFGNDELQPGSDFLSEVHPEDELLVRSVFRQTVATGSSRRVEYRIVPPDQNIRHMEAQGSVIHHSEDERYVLWVCHDITERKLAEKKIREQAALLDEAHDAICVNDLDQNILFWNKGAERLYGWMAHEAVGRNANELLFQDEVALTAVKTLIHRGEWHGELHQVTKTGAKLIVESRWTLIYDADGAAKSILVINTNTTERKIAEAKIREQAALLDKAQDAILVRNLNDEITYWNEGAARLYGWTAKEAIDRPANTLIFDKAFDTKATRDELFRKGEWFGEVPQVTKAGREIIVHSRKTLIRDAEGRPVSILSINSDITEKKQIEAQFLRAQRLENLGTLAGGIAHDLNNILAPIMLAVELIQSDPQGEGSARMLETVASSAKRGSELVKQILSFARGAGGEKSALQIRPLISEIEKLVATTFPRTIEVRTTAPRDLPDVLGDATQLHQVLLNLCVNARDAMPEGGKLTIGATAVQLKDRKTSMLRAPISGLYVELTVTDTGTGISPEIQERIFEPFFTTKEAGKGTGLGLSTVIGIVKSHGGFLEVTSEVGDGTTFHVYLPVPAKAALSRTESVTNKPAHGRGEQILVVDDEAAIVEITCTTLSAFNYRPLTASNGAEAVEIFARNNPGIDMVITDVMMPGMDVIALVDTLHDINPDVKIIAVSGYASPEKLRDLEDRHVTTFLKKPFTTASLLNSMDSLLHV